MAGGDDGVSMQVGVEPSAQRAGDRLVVAALAGTAVVLALVATWKGPGLTDDSVNYLSSGVNIAQGRGWVMLADQPLTIFPPGIAALVAVGEVVGLTGQTTLRVVNILSFGAIVVLGHRLLQRVVSHRGVVVGATVLLAGSPALLGVSKMAWSEPLFVVVTLVFLLALGRVVDRRDITWRDVAVLTALGASAFLIRYIGLSLVALGGMALLAYVRPLDRRTLGRVAVFGLLSTLVPIACVLRNHAADGSYLGKRIPSPDSIGDSSYRVLVTLGEWTYPGAGTATRSLATIGAVTATLVLGGVIAALRAPGRRSLRWRTTSESPATLVCCAGFVVVYSAYLVAASLGTAFEAINSRYLSPIYVPLVVLTAAGLATVIEGTRGRAWRRAIAVVPAVLIAFQVVTSVDDVRIHAADGIGYNASGFVDSDLAAQALSLVEADDQAVLYSNLPFGLWSATRLQPIRWAPLASGFRGAPIEGELDRLVRQVSCAPNSSYLVRYRFGHPRAMSNDEMKTALDVKRVVAAEDGAIFQLTTDRRVPCTTPAPRATRPR